MLFRILRFRQRTGSQADQAGDVPAADQSPGGWCRPALGDCRSRSAHRAPVDRLHRRCRCPAPLLQRLSQQAQCLPAQAVTVADAQPAVGVRPSLSPEARQVATGQGLHVGPASTTGQLLGLPFTGIQHQQPGAWRGQRTAGCSMLGCWMLYWSRQCESGSDRRQHDHARQGVPGHRCPPNRQIRRWGWCSSAA